MRTLLVILIFSSAMGFATEKEVLEAQKAVALDGKAAKFDFMVSDEKQHRIVAAHKGAGVIEILDLGTGKILKSVEVGEVQGVAVDSAGNRYFAGNDGDHSLVIINSHSFKKMGEVKVPGPVDAIAFDTKNKMVYAAEDDGLHVWVIDPALQTLVATIELPGTPEFMEYDADSDRLYLNLKSKNLLAKINPETNLVEASWSTLPATTPHGLALDSERKLAYVTGSNGKLVGLDLTSGKVTRTADIAKGVDQTAFDPGTQLIFNACKGFVSVVKTTDDGFEKAVNALSPKGAHTLALDLKSHSAWVSYADEKKSYLKEFRLAQ